MTKLAGRCRPTQAMEPDLLQRQLRLSLCYWGRGRGTLAESEDIESNHQSGYNYSTKASVRRVSYPLLPPPLLPSSAPFSVQVKRTPHRRICAYSPAAEQRRLE